MPCKGRVFSTHTKASSHSKKKVNKFTHVSVQAHISSYTANIMNSIQHCHMAHQIQILQRVAVVEPSQILQAEQSIQSSCQTAYELAYSMLITCISGCYISELIDSLSSKTFKYSHETMMWWTTGYKMFGGRWLRLMAATDAHGGKSFT